MTDPRPSQPRAARPQVPNWVILGAVGLFLVLSGVITMIGGAG